MKILAEDSIENIHGVLNLPCDLTVAEFIEIRMVIGMICNLMAFHIHSADFILIGLCPHAEGKECYLDPPLRQAVQQLISIGYGAVIKGQRNQLAPRHCSRCQRKAGQKACQNQNHRKNSLHFLYLL